MSQKIVRRTHNIAGGQEVLGDLLFLPHEPMESSDI